MRGYVRLLVANALTVAIAGCGKRHTYGEYDHGKFRRWYAGGRGSAGWFRRFYYSSGEERPSDPALPEGIARYRIAYVCPSPTIEIIASIAEFVIEAIVEDGLPLPFSCSALAPRARATVTGSVGE